jgi:O-antigen/teichoic acid export membrane protein
MSAGIALVADEMVSLLLGPKWLPSVLLVRLPCVYAAARALDTLLPPVLFARHRERFLFLFCLTLLILVPAAAIVGALRGGAPGAIMLSTPVYCVLMIMAREALAEVEGSFSQFWNEIWPILADTVVVAAVVLLLHQFAFAERTERALIELMIELVLLSVSGAMTYLIVLWTIGSPVMGEAAEVAGWILRRAAQRAD